MSKTTDVMETIRRLMARAEHPTTPPAEAELALRQANRMMSRHAIDEAVPRMSQTESERRKPVIEKWHWAESYTEFGPSLRSMLESIAEYNRVRIVIDTYAPFGVTVVGMKEDVDWVQMLYTNCYLTFMSKLDPSWDKRLGIPENVYRLKVAGRMWEDIWMMMARDGFDLEIATRYDYSKRRHVPEVPRWQDIDKEPYYRLAPFSLPCEPTSRGYQYLFRAYHKHRKAIGDENPIGTQRHDAYRRSFAEGFASEINHRLFVMHNDTKEEIKSSGAELVLRDSWEDVEAAFYGEFPNMHPDRIREQALERQRVSEEAERRRLAERDEMLSKMTDKQRADFLEKERRKEEREYRASENYWNRRDFQNRTESSGAKNGRSAARSVNLTRADNVGGSNSKQIDG